MNVRAPSKSRALGATCSVVMGASSFVWCRCCLCGCLALGCTTYDESFTGGSASMGGDPGAGGTVGQTSKSGGSGSVEGSGGAASSGNRTGTAGTEASAGKGGGSTVASGGTSANGGAEAAGATNDGGGTAMAGAAGAPSCDSETVSEFCARTAKDCGLASGTDNCGMPVSAAECGACPVLKSCGGAGQPNVCGALTELAGGTAQSRPVFNTSVRLLILTQAKVVEQARRAHQSPRCRPSRQPN